MQNLNMVLILFQVQWLPQASFWGREPTSRISHGFAIVILVWFYLFFQDKGIESGHRYHLQKNTKMPSKELEILPHGRHVTIQINTCHMLVVLWDGHRTGNFHCSETMASSSFKRSLHSWPKSWVMGAFKPVILQAFQDTRLRIITRNKAGLNVAGKL